MTDKSTTYPVVEAVYASSTVGNYAGNPLIEALPQLPADEAVFDSICWQPDFSPEERSLATGIRIARLLELRNLMIPLERHSAVIHTLDALVRSAYVNRGPNSPERARTAQQLYEMRQRGDTFRQRPNVTSIPLSTVLFGIPGMGKTSLVRRWSDALPKVVHHSQHHIYQVPVLHADAPTDGTSLKGFCYALLHELDARIPGANYYHEYGTRGKPGAYTLLANVIRLANMHHLGMLVIDETQNFKKTHKSDETIMTEIVSAFNLLHAPILFMGTNKAYEIFETDFRGARRAVAVALPHWDRLTLTPGAGEPEEWLEFVAKLWEFQWVRIPIDLDEWMVKVLYECTQGIIAILVALFAAAQMRAMLNGSEKLTPTLIQDVYQSQFKPVHPMIKALRDNNRVALEAYQDIAPLNKSLEKIWRLGSPTQARGAETGSACTASFTAPSSDADAPAAGRIRKARIPSRVPGAPGRRQKKEPRTNAATEPVDLDPKDYRNATCAAAKNHSSAYEELLRLKLVPSAEDFLGMF